MRKPVVWLLLACVLGCGASRLHLHTPAIRRIEGRATLLTLDKPGSQPKKFLNVRTDLGEQILVLGDAAQLVGQKETDFVSGTRVSLQGVFLSRGAGAVRVVSGHPVAKAQYCFVGNAINKAAGARSTPRAAQTVTYGPPPPYTGVPAQDRTAPIAALGRLGAPASATQQTSAANELLPRDEAGLPIASAAWVGLGPAGQPALQPPRRSLAQAGTAALPRTKFVNNTLVMDRMTTIIIPMSANESTGAICPGTSKPRGCPNTPCTAAQLRKVLFSSTALGGNPAADTVTRGFEKCSFGKTKFEATAKVVDPIVNIPCSGITNGVAWTFTKCDFDDFNGYADKADEVLAKRGINMDNYRYAVYLLPPSIGCAWVGLGYVGCDGSFRCRVWISGDFWTTAQAMVHELQHNLFLNHAAGYNEAGDFDEYHDSTCPMGHCCTNRCPNVVHGWQMGWYQLQQFDPEHLKPGTTLAVRLAAGATLARAPAVQGVRLNITWSKLVPEPLFIGYRSNTANTPDALLEPAFVNRVHIYSSPVSNTYDASLTTYKKALGFKAGCTATSDPPCVWSVADVVVRVAASNATQATITICRKVFGGKETRATCMARVDGDCNGRVNTTDAACVALMRTTTPKAATVPLVKRADVKPANLTAGAAGVAAAQPGPGRKLTVDSSAEQDQQPVVQGEVPPASGAAPEEPPPHRPGGHVPGAA